jgi:molecular chaperone DnaK (HSP70)
MAEAKYLIGIDLGTSNCALAYVEPARGAEAPVQDFPMLQLQDAGQAATLPLLPSALYLAGEHELPAGATGLPWTREGTGLVVGEFARRQGTRVPGRLVTSAKSWLCHPGVDRSAPILPWGASGQVAKISPVEASARLLEHLAHAWDFGHPEAPLAKQQVVITVPASFDEAARALTATAAARAGYEKFTLLEEPQAAFYDFIARHRGDLRQTLEGIRLLLVVDVGGGTSDFTLIHVKTGPEGVGLRRIAVGEHLMLGGDNMDAAISRVAENRMVRGARRLTTAQWSQLLLASRVAKEKLLHDGRRDDEPLHHLSVGGEGSQLIGGSLSTHISRAEVEQVILEGFFPKCAAGDQPQSAPRVALQELGLPYAQDPAVTRHLAAFLRAHARAVFAALGGAAAEDVLPRPDAILLNGGVFNSPAIARRLVEAVSAWWPDGEIPLLHHDSLDLAVARGAAYYGLVRHGLGQRIGGGAAHALYLGLDKAGAGMPVALCVMPRGQEEGQLVNIGERVFHLAVEKPVRFPLFSTAADRIDRAGDLVPVTDDLRPLPPIHTLLKSSRSKVGNVPVHLSAVLTEIGTLELWCVSNTTPERWRLEFELRGSGSEPSFGVTASLPAGFNDARLWIDQIFGGKTRKAFMSPGQKADGSARHRAAAPRDVKQLWISLERSIGAREDWGLPVLRELWGALFAGAAKRRRSAEHERVFYQLLGYTLRPGFGYPLDEWRCEQSATLFAEGVQFHQDKTVWNEFWILWRRLAGGLNEQRHQEIWTFLKPWLGTRIAASAKPVSRPKGIRPEGLNEMVRLAASLEHLDPVEKGLLGDWIVTRLEHPATASGPWTWALGRLGARTPIFGSVHKVLPPDTAAAWARRLLGPETLKLDGSLFALAQLARLTGDRERDLDASVRAQVLAVLEENDASPSWRRMLTEVVSLGAADRARALGDTLPVGLTVA